MPGDPGFAHAGACQASHVSGDVGGQGWTSQSFALTAGVLKAGTNPVTQHVAFEGGEHTAHIAVRKLMAGIRRAKGTAQRGKRPVTVDDLRRMLAGLSA